MGTKLALEGVSFILFIVVQQGMNEYVIEQDGFKAVVPVVHLPRLSVFSLPCFGVP